MAFLNNVATGVIKLKENPEISVSAPLTNSSIGVKPDFNSQTLLKGYTGAILEFDHTSLYLANNTNRYDELVL